MALNSCLRKDLSSAEEWVELWNVGFYIGSTLILAIVD